MRHPLLLLLLLALSGTLSADAYRIELSAEAAQQLGQKIWHNEGAGKVENLTVWNRGEAFPSFGIGHFIWYPAGERGPFSESFPQLIASLQQSQKLPHWLTQATAAPWANREAFYRDINSPRMKALRNLLQRATAQQIDFIVKRLEVTLPKMLQATKDKTARQKIENRFYRVAETANGLYALIDYVNFKGEGTAPSERYRGQGWGLRQLLLEMRDNRTDIMREFARAADVVLTRRVKNAPRDESHWLPGWRKRLQSYL